MRLYGQRWPVTDLTPASIARMLIEALVDEVMLMQHELASSMEAWYLLSASGNELTRRARDFGIEYERQPAVYATGEVIVTASGPATLPAGFQFATEDGNKLYAALPSGTGGDWSLNTGMNPIMVQALSVGEAGNTAAHTITRFASNPPNNIVAVDNPAAIVSGRDAESDDELRARIILLLRGEGPSKTQLERRVLALKDASGQPLVESLAWVELDGLVGPGGMPVAAYCYVSGPSGATPPQTVAACQSVIDTYRAAGMPIAVAAATRVPVTVRLRVEFDGSMDVTAARHAVLGTVYRYFAGLGVAGTTEIADSVLRPGAIEAALVKLAGVRRVRVEDPANDVAVSYGARVVLGSAEVTRW